MLVLLECQLVFGSSFSDYGSEALCGLCGLYRYRSPRNRAAKSLKLAEDGLDFIQRHTIPDKNYRGLLFMIKLFEYIPKLMESLEKSLDPFELASGHSMI